MKADTAIEIDLKEWFEKELTEEDLELLAFLKTIGLEDYLDVWKMLQSSRR